MSILSYKPPYMFTYIPTYHYSTGWKRLLRSVSISNQKLGFAHRLRQAQDTCEVLYNKRCYLRVLLRTSRYLYLSYGLTILVPP